MAEMLEHLYYVPAYYFTTGFRDNIQLGIEALEKQKEIFNSKRFFTLF